MFCLLRLLPQLSAHLKASFQALNLFTEVSRRERGRLWKQFSLSISFSLLRSLKTWTRFIKAPLFVYLFFSLSLSLSLFPLHVSSSSVHSSTQAAAVCSCFENHRKIERERERESKREWWIKRRSPFMYRKIETLVVAATAACHRRSTVTKRATKLIRSFENFF